MCQFFFFSISFHVASLLLLMMMMCVFFFLYKQKRETVLHCLFLTRMFSGHRTVYKKSSNNNNKTSSSSSTGEQIINIYILYTMKWIDDGSKVLMLIISPLSLLCFSLNLTVFFILILFTTPQSEFNANQMEHIFGFSFIVQAIVDALCMHLILFFFLLPFR